jgi:Galactose oxidase, central domain
LSHFLWTQKTDIGPHARISHRMAYDSIRSETVLFGGNSMANILNDTWTWQGEHWTQVADIGPDPRSDYAMCFDVANKAILLFGGTGAKVYADTWSWDGTNWTQIADIGPAARSHHHMVYDATRARCVVFGGQSATGVPLGDTWEWDGQAWTEQQIEGPSARSDYALSFDLVRGRTVLFGGNSNGVSLQDTWTWDGSGWTQSANFGATSRAQTAMVSTDVQTTMFGGFQFAVSSSPVVLGDSWVYDGAHWTERENIGPGPRYSHAMAYDSGRRTIVLFGGISTNTAVSGGSLSDYLLGGTWEHVEADSSAAPAPAQG